MCPVGTTVSFTHASTRPVPEPTAGSVLAGLAALVKAGWRLALLGLLLLALAGWARADQPQVLREQLQRGSDGLYLTVRLDLTPSRTVEDVLVRGVPLYFVWQADVFRQRWYWTDRRVATVQRTLRLAYQPLTRRWRLSLANSPAGGGGGAGLQYALHQNFDSLADALAVVGRVTRWRLAGQDEIEPDARHRVEWRMQLDLALLPRPFQIGVANQPAWDIAVTRRLRVPDTVEDVPAADPVSASAPSVRGREVDAGLIEPGENAAPGFDDSPRRD